MICQVRSEVGSRDGVIKALIEAATPSRSGSGNPLHHRYVLACADLW
ncbi:hypothetical protein OG413_43575 [Streptomyces sp. NBC_01433]|nr:hypothetical protein [Streptomyces sp. NBC_01433]MCX4682065.1 hypothetical protein [Streptomyces sp. NBC_01433]